MDDFQKESLLFRDLLAVERTRMANERTLMTYIRTSLMIFASGVSLIEIYKDILFLQILGAVLLPIAVVMIVVSAIRYMNMKKNIRRKLN